jgi:hypothetical protein
MHRRILGHPDFQSGNFHTKFLDEVNIFEEVEECKDSSATLSKDSGSEAA